MNRFSASFSWLLNAWAWENCVFRNFQHQGSLAATGGKKTHNWEFKNQTKTMLSTGKSQWSHKARDMAVAFTGSALLHFKGGCTAPEGEAWVWCSHSNGLAGPLWLSLGGILHWRMLGLLELLHLLPVVKASAFAGRSKCLYYLLTLPQIIEMGGENDSIDSRGKGKECPAPRPSMAISKCSDWSLFPCSEQGPCSQSSAFLLEILDHYCAVPSCPVPVYLYFLAEKVRSPPV